MLNIFRLRIGALLHFLIAIGHLICLFFLEEAFKAYGILDEMKHLCFGQEWLLYAVTVCLAAGFAIAGFYALSVAGDLRKLPATEIGDDRNCWLVFYQGNSRDRLAVV